MLISWRILGIVIGLLLTAVTVRLVDLSHQPPPPGGPILSECDGALRSIVIQYVSDADSASVYRQFLPKLPSDVRVYVVCPDQAAFDQLRSFVGDVSAKLTPILTHHAMTTWSRDRWIALRLAEDGKPTILVCPRHENIPRGIAGRQGDERIAPDIAGALKPSVYALRSDLYFDGGDLAADEENVFVTPAVQRRNVQHTVHDAEELTRRLHDLLGRNIILLDDAPDHHAAMFMMPVGRNTVLVGDVSLGESLVSVAEPGVRSLFPTGPDLTDKTKKQFDAVASAAARAGYRVVRVPVLCDLDGRCYLTYTNSILDVRDGRRTVYMPVYEGLASMNDLAEQTWREAGWDVVRINCMSVYRHGGCLHCLVNVMER
jgi:hypothetical protein